MFHMSQTNKITKTRKKESTKTIIFSVFSNFRTFVIKIFRFPRFSFNEEGISVTLGPVCTPLFFKELIKDLGRAGYVLIFGRCFAVKRATL
jgi:hypothetical protein